LGCDSFKKCGIEGAAFLYRLYEGLIGTLMPMVEGEKPVSTDRTLR
jgi:hypothetical protein